MSLEGVPESAVRLDAPDLRTADPGGLVTRLENRLHRIEDNKTATVDQAERASRELAHADANVGQPFQRAAQLIEARDRSRQIDEQLQQIAQPQQAVQQAEPEADMEAGQ